MNNGVWKSVEERSRTYVNQPNNNLYIIAGGAGYDSTRVDTGYPEPLLRNEIFKRIDGTFHFGKADGPIIGDTKLQQINSENPGLLENALSVRLIYKHEDGTFRNETPNGAIISDSDLEELHTKKSNLDSSSVGKPITIGDSILVTNSKQIHVPQYFWKILLPLSSGQNLNDITENTQVIAVIMPNRDRLSDNTGPHTISLPNGVEPLTITKWNDWTQWQVSVDDLEQITGYDFFSNLPIDIQAKLEARRTDRFLNGVPLLAANDAAQSSEVFPFQFGESVDLSIWQDNSYGTVIPNITKPNFSSSEISVSKSEILGQNIFKIGSSESSFSEGSITQISSFESSIIQVTPIEINTIQNTVIQVGSTKFGILESSPIQVGPVKTSPIQVGFIEGNILQISPSEVGSNQNNSSQIQVIQTGTTPINTGEVSFSSVIALTQFFSIHNLTNTPDSFLEE